MEWTKSVLVLASLFVVLVALLPSVQPCKSCQYGSHVSNGLDPRSATNLRVEVIKQKILNKLRMEKVPVINKPKRTLPKNIFYEMSMFNDSPIAPPITDNGSPDVEDPPGLDEFYARENQMAIFGEVVSAGRCINKVHNQIACVTFTLPSVIFKKTIQSAYMHLNVKRGHSHHHQLTIRDVRYNMQMSISEEEVVATMEGHKEGWLPIDMAGSVRRWTRRDAQTSFTVQISCDTCNHQEAQRILALDGETAPFLLINTEAKRGSRNRRGLDCTSTAVQCCRESLYINFTDIGWDTWILEPHGYMANYCKGQCGGNVQSPTLHHSALLADNQQSKRPSANHDTAQASSCCAPTRMSSVSMLFYDGDGAVHRSILPNMSVESCGCT